MNDTPETNKAERMAWSQEYMVETEFARKLERERDEARKEAEYYKERYEQLKDDLDEAREQVNRYRYNLDLLPIKWNI